MNCLRSQHGPSYPSLQLHRSDSNVPPLGQNLLHGFTLDSHLLFSITPFGPHFSLHAVHPQSQWGSSFGSSLLHWPNTYTRNHSVHRRRDMAMMVETSCHVWCCYSQVVRASSRHTVTVRWFRRWGSLGRLAIKRRRRYKSDLRLIRRWNIM